MTYAIRLRYENGTSVIINTVKDAKAAQKSYVGHKGNLFGDEIGLREVALLRNGDVISCARLFCAGTSDEFIKETPQ